MKTQDKHKWNKQPNDDSGNKIWVCSKCGCKKILGNYKFASPDYCRSGQIMDYRPDCTNMSRRSDEILD